jgi:hypothetical protein
MSQKRTDNFLQNFVAYTDGTEIPPTYALWAGLSGVSCVLGRRCWVDMGIFTIYPNLYVVFVAGPAVMRKSTAIDQIRNILYELTPPPKILSQKMTTEAIIETLQETKLDVVAQCLTFEGGGTAFILASELTSLLNRKSLEGGLEELLIECFDCVKIYEYRTKARGLEQIKSPCLGMLGATTMDLISRAIPEESVGTGLSSRVLFIYSDVAGKPVPRPVLTDDKRARMELMIRQLTSISSLEGEFKLTDEAWAYYHEDYNHFYYNNPYRSERVMSGYSGRRAVHQLKLAMIFSACDGNDRVVSIDHIRAATKLLEQTEPMMKGVLDIIIASDYGRMVDLVYTTIKQFGSKGAPRTQLLRKLSNRLSAKELTDAIDLLTGAGRLSTQINPPYGVFYKVVEGT